MSWWQRLFGPRGLPHRDRAPAAAVDGARDGERKRGLWIEREEWDWQLAEVQYRDGVRQGPYRLWNKDDRVLRERGTYVDGHKHGTIETLLATGTVRARYEMAAGKLHGRLEMLRPDGTVETAREYRDGEMYDGPYVIPGDEGVAIHRSTYVAGKLVGPWEDNDWAGRPKLHKHYVDGVLDGPYREYHAHLDGGGLRLAGDYRAGKRIGRWTYHDRDGSVAASIDHDGGAVWRTEAGSELPAGALDGDDLARWMTLARAWDQLGSHPDGHWFRVEHAVDAWPEAERAPAIAWVAGRIAERPDGPARTTYGRGWISHLVELDDDPRAALIDGIVIDHHEWDEAAVARVVKRAPQLRTLSLYECHVEPGVAALFPAGVAWPRLDELAIEECGELGGLVELLAAAPWARALRDLALDDDGCIAGDAAAALVASPHLGGLRRLRLRNVERGLAGAIAAAPMFDTLEELSLYNVHGLDEVLRAIGDRATPRLRELEIEACDEAISGPTLTALCRAAGHPALASVSIQGATGGPWKRSLAAIRKARPALELALD